MSSPKKTKLHQVLRRRRISTRTLARSVGLNVRTIHNISCGSSRSQEGRQKITNFLGEQIWPDVPVTERKLVFSPEVEVESSTVKAAIEFAKQFPKNLVRRTGRIVNFSKPFSVIILDDPGGS